MTAAQVEHVRAVASSLEQRIKGRSEQGLIDKEAVLALDVVAHALTFAKSPDGVTLWREALWQRRLSEPSRAALNELLSYIVDATARGELGAASSICNCLEAVVGREPFSAGRDPSDGHDRPTKRAF